MFADVAKAQVLGHEICGVVGTENFPQLKVLLATAFCNHKWRTRIWRVFPPRPLRWQILSANDESVCTIASADMAKSSAMHSIPIACVAALTRKGMKFGLS